MAYPVSEISQHLASEKTLQKTKVLASKRKAAEIDNGQDPWMPPENPVRARAESGTFDIRHRMLKSCLFRAAGHRPAVAKDMATARLSVVAVRALIKKMKLRKTNLDITERKDLMILDRKLRVSEAFQNGYFGHKLKNQTETAYKRMRDREISEGKETFSEHWEEEKQKALAYYIESQEDSVEFDFRDWKRFEMEIRAEFENDKAEVALPELVNDAYKEGQYCRLKRRKVISSPKGASGEDAPMFEGSSSNFEEETTKPIVTIPTMEESNPGNDKGEGADKAGSSLPKDFEDSAHAKMVEEQGECYSPPDVQYDVGGHRATFDDRHHPANQDFEEDLATSSGKPVPTNGRARVPNLGKPKKRSFTDPTFAGINKQKGQGRKRSPLCDGEINTESFHTYPTSTVTGQHGADVLLHGVESQFKGMHSHRAAVLTQQTPASKEHEEMKAEAHIDTPAPDEDIEFDRSVADFEAMMEAEAIAECRTDTVPAAGTIDTGLEPECCKTSPSLKRSYSEACGTDDEVVFTSIVKDAPIHDDACECDYEEGETLNSMDTVKAITGLPGNHIDLRHEGGLDKCNNSSATAPDLAVPIVVPDQTSSSPPDKVDKDYFDLISSASKTWILAVKMRIANRNWGRQAERGLKSIPPIKTLLDYHRDPRKNQ